MRLSQQQIEGLRRVETDIFLELIRICEKLDLKYFIVQGTLLGAVRHKGFIPWDDDIDVGMLREDYEIFIREAPKLLPDIYFLQYLGSDSAYPHGFAKIRKKGTTFIETASKNINMNHGIYIDVFPFDYYPDNKLKEIVYDVRKLLIRYRIRSVYYIPSDNTFNMVNIVRRMIRFVSKIFYPTVEKALIKQDELYKQYKTGKRVINNGGPWGKRELLDKSLFDNVVKLSFEGMDVSAPQGYEKYLTSVYGDYMELPPVEKRVSHHYLSFLDFDKSYEYYMDVDDNKDK